MEMGLRQRKKQQTRQLIADTAWRLFADHGFDQVTVAHIAREAEVAVATVFNYFPTKEALFFSPLETFEAHLLEAVATRPAGEPVLAAFRRFLLAAGGLLAQADAGDAQALERLRTLNRVTAASPTLQVHEHRTLAATADALAALLAAETNAQPDDPRPQVAASALLGVQRALVDYTRQRVLADPTPTGLAADVQRHAEAAFALLDRGLGDYAPKGGVVARR